MIQENLHFYTCTGFCLFRPRDNGFKIIWTICEKKKKEEKKNESTMMNTGLLRL